MLTHWSLCYLSSGKGNVCWAELSPTSITHISCLGDTISQYTSKQHITWLTNTGTKMRKAGTPAAPMSACFIDRVGRLQVTVIHCSVHASQGGKSLWHKDPLKVCALYNFCTQRKTWLSLQPSWERLNCTEQSFWITQKWLVHFEHWPGLLHARHCGRSRN